MSVGFNKARFAAREVDAFDSAVSLVELLRLLGIKKFGGIRYVKILDYCDRRNKAIILP